MEFKLENAQTRGMRLFMGEEAALRRQILDYLHPGF